MYGRGLGAATSVIGQLPIGSFNEYGPIVLDASNKPAQTQGRRRQKARIEPRYLWSRVEGEPSDNLYKRQNGPAAGWCS